MLTETVCYTNVQHCGSTQHKTRGWKLEEEAAFNRHIYYRTEKRVRVEVQRQP